MPLDHYVSQVHLKNFYSPILGNRMYAIRKSDLKEFTPDANSVCRIEDNSTIHFLDNPREIEGFLQEIEPLYNKSINKLAEYKIDYECIHAIAGFVAYILTCSPTALRLNSSHLTHPVEAAAMQLDKNGVIPPAPPELGGMKLSELLVNGKVDIKITDKKFPQAIGVYNIRELTSRLASFKWEILHNTYDDTSPFFTCDFPIAFEITSQGLFNKIVPLSPKLAIRIIPTLAIKTKKSNNHIKRKLNYSDVQQVNRLVVRCAEDLVFYRDNHNWIPLFVRKNSKYHIKPTAVKLPNGNKQLIITSHIVSEI